MGISSSRINKKQVKEYLDNLNIYYSEDLNHIQPKDLKELTEMDVTDFFETSQKKGYVPKDWRGINPRK